MITAKSVSRDVLLNESHELTMSKKRILVIQLRQLGDILLTTPCLREIKAGFPDSHLTMLTHRMGRHILDQCPYLDEHLVHAPGNSLRDLVHDFNLARRLRTARFDLVIDFMNNPRSAILTFSSGAPERISFSSSRSFVYTKVIPREGFSGYIVQDKFRLLHAIGLKPSSQNLILPWFESHTPPTRSLIEKHPFLSDSRLRVVISPTHRRTLRKWPLARYAALSDMLIKRLNASVIWIWGPGEEQEIDEGISRCEEKAFVIKAPPTSFRELAALIANTDLFIGNSNGPSHIAVATNICSLQLHGPTSKYDWCPLTSQHTAIQSEDLGTKGNPDIAAITLEYLWKQLEQMSPVFHKQREKREKKRFFNAWSESWESFQV